MKRIMGRKAALLLGVPIAALLGNGVAFAQASPGAQPAAVAPSSNAMINLVRLLVEQGTITRDKGDALIAEAEQEAAQASLAAQSVAQASAAAAPVVAQAGGALPPPPTGTIRVPYIPETVRAQIREELKADVLKQARAQGWASPEKAAPEWVRAFKLYGDLRLRSQSNLFSRFNSTQIPNFQEIVAGGPLDLINSQIPYLNTTEDKYGQMRIRARLGANITVNPRLTVGIELASGNDSSPVTTNATLGGGFSKRNFYLYKAWVEAKPTDWATITAGRMDNPFLTTDALFDPDLKFDGVAGEVKTPGSFGDFAALKLRGGAFPLDFGNQNFPDTAASKSTAPQKWLFSGQIEGDFNFGERTSLSLAVGYHHFANLRGRPSAPCALYLGATQCSTDGSAPFFVQNGNTLSFIRRIVLDPTLPSTTVQAQPQLLGLTMSYHVLDALAVLTLPVGDRYELNLSGDYLRNLAFRRSDVCRYGLAGEPVNNGGSGGSGNICDTDVAKRTPFVGGNQGFQAMVKFGFPTPNRWGEWKVFAGYKYLESDAVLDSFTDDDFHLGGTNAKGYILGGVFGVSKGVTVGGRWLSTNEITGEQLAIDVAQLDLNVAF